MEFPPMVRIRQIFPDPRVDDIEGTVRSQIARSRLRERLAPGARIAVAAGSRGINNIGRIVGAVIAELRTMGFEPFVVPAMGSHGGATPDGQREILASYGIAPETTGAPVVSSLDVVKIGELPNGTPVVWSRDALAADGVVIVNRVKPHTDFRGTWESGLVKMMVIGLGKQRGAENIHQHGVRGLRDLIPQAARVILGQGKVALGVAVVENAYDETARVEVLPPGAIAAREPALFAQARAWMPRLPVDAIDVLVVDEMGKTFSGTGMDVNVIGRWRHREVPDPPSPRVRRIVALRLADASEGNAQGVGLADVVTRRLAEAIDFGATYLNAIVSTYLERVFLPLVAPSDRAAIAVAVRTLGLHDPAAVRIVRIPNTLHLERLWVSPAVAAEVQDVEGVTLGRTVPWRFTPAGDLEVWGPAAWEEDEGAAADAGPDAPGRSTVADHER